MHHFLKLFDCQKYILTSQEASVLYRPALLFPGVISDGFGVSGCAELEK